MTEQELKDKLTNTGLDLNLDGKKMWSWPDMNVIKELEWYERKGMKGNPFLSIFWEYMQKHYFLGVTTIMMGEGKIIQVFSFKSVEGKNV